MVTTHDSDRIDLRSDTVTRPTPEMRRAMAEAEVGDDVFGDDPNVNALEERAAELTGKEAGLFVTSGTQGNLVCQLAHVPRGGEIIAEAESHTVFDEAAGHAVVTGASIRGISARPDGTMDPQAIREAFRDPQDLHEPITALVVLENTHAHTMGQPLTAAYTAEIAAIAHAGGVPLHVDGARLWNAAVALGTSARALLGDADSATMCLSKGLACPVGSVVVGQRDFIWRARRARKLLGGGMRQAGILAAAGLIALRDGPAGMIERLAEDHANARRLGEALAELPGVRDLDPTRIHTDFVIFRVAGERPQRDAFLGALESRGVLMVAYPHGQVRAVTHYGIEPADVERTIGAARDALAEIGAGARPIAVPG
ncbi:MAG: GntG family PLP-dependent aldolase [Candidatus Limnocylindrales bacterium]